MTVGSQILGNLEYIMARAVHKTKQFDDGVQDSRELDPIIICMNRHGTNSIEQIYSKLYIIVKEGNVIGTKWPKLF